MDYRKFLSKSETLVLPYFGGTRVDAPDRRLRIIGSDDGARRDPGWYTFTVEGRRARFGERADPADLSQLPAVRGHWAGGYLFSKGGGVERPMLAPEEEPEPLAPCVGRRWHGGALLIDGVDFEDDPEMQARLALEELRPIGDVKGVTPTLRAAFGYALLAAVARELEIPVSPREAMQNIGAIAERGREAAVEVLEEIAERRREHQILHAARTARGRGPARRVPVSPQERADKALEDAGARMLRCRSLSDWQLEVTFQLAGERFICVCDAFSLHVYDAGICLSGADEELTLESLPSAIREAIDTGELYITRR